MKKTNTLKSSHHQHKTEKQGKDPEVDIPYITAEGCTKNAEIKAKIPATHNTVSFLKKRIQVSTNGFIINMSFTIFNQQIQFIQNKSIQRLVEFVKSK